jgi:hypothetical protein
VYVRTRKKKTILLFFFAIFNFFFCNIGRHTIAPAHRGAPQLERRGDQQWDAAAESAIVEALVELLRFCRTM